MPDLQEVANAVNEIYRDLYQGEGKDRPSLMTRVYDVEKVIADFRTLKWLMVAAIFTAIGDMVSKFWK